MSPIGFLFLKLPPPPCAVLLVWNDPRLGMVYGFGMFWVYHPVGTTCWGIAETSWNWAASRCFETFWDLSWHLVTSRDMSWKTDYHWLIWHTYDIYMTYIYIYDIIWLSWPHDPRDTQRYSATGVAQPLTSLLDQPCWSTISSPKTCNKWKPTFSPKIGPKWFSNLQFVDFKHVWNSTFVAIR